MRDRSYFRPGKVLHSFSRLYPDAWTQVDEFRARGKELGDWPDWCLLRPHVRRAHWHSLWVGKRDRSDARSVR